jgi:predicted metal-dependent phosphotriesterase family hydrolase
MLSHDYCTYLDFGGNRWENRKADYAEHRTSGYANIHRHIIPKLLDSGVSESQIQQIFVENPKNFFTGGRK